MANVVILKQPLYGSVIWNGVEFEYTPNPDFIGNDTYTYKITDVNGSRVLTNYVNPTNLPPIAKNITVNAISNDLTEVDILQMVDDATDPFKYLTITNIKSDMVMGSVRTDGKKIYFVAGFFNSTEYVDYTVTDKQFETSGRITFKITGGIDPESYKGSPYTRFAVLLAKTTEIKRLSSGWSSMYDTMAVRGPSWDAINAYRYNAMSDVVSSSPTNANYIKWNSSFLNVIKFDTFSTNVTSNSSTWEDYRVLGDSTYDLIDNVVKVQNSQHDYLLSENPIWSGNIYVTSSLSAIYGRVYNNMFSTSTTIIANSGDKWDGTELNNISAGYFHTWSEVNDVLYTDQNAPKWDKVSSDFDLLSTEVKINTDNIVNTYSSVTSNSGYWNSSELNSFSALNFPNWDQTYIQLTASKIDWDNNKTDIELFSSVYYKDVLDYNKTYNTVSTNSAIIWDGTILNTFSADHFDNLNNFKDVTFDKNAKWDTNNKNIYDFASEYYKLTDNTTKAYNIFDSNSSKWIISTLDTFSADNFDDWNDWHNLVSLSSNSWYDSNNANFVTDYNSSSSYKDVYTTVLNKSANWGHTGFDAYSAKNFTEWNSLRKTINDNIIDWGDFSYTDLTSFSASYYSDTPKYTQTDDTVTKYSYRWGHTSFDSYSAKNFPRWDFISTKILDINSTKTALSTFSAAYFDNAVLFNDFYYTVYTKASTNWDLSFVSIISSYIQKFDDSYDIIINTSDNIDKWDEMSSSSSTFSGLYTSASKNFDSYTSTVGQNIAFWNDKSASTVLTSNSGNWQDTYLNTFSLSDEWFFDEKLSLVSVQTTVTANSAQWNESKQSINSSNNNWTNTNSLISSISSNSLSGSDTITLSTKDLFVYGNTNIKGNLSALGKRIKVNTSLYTISGFSITNDGTSYALNVEKNGGFDKAIVNFDTLSSTVLYVKASNSVGINLSSFPSTNALTVSGNISASGTVYPLHPSVTTYISNSGKYTSTYNYITAVSSNFYSVCALSANYKQLTDYISLSGTNLINAKNNIPSYNSMLGSTQANSAINNSINEYVVASGAYFGLDSYFRDNKQKYDNLYSAATTISSTGKAYNINVLFSYPNIVQSKKINYVVQDNIKINSWTMVSDVPTVAQIKILSALNSDYPTTVDITNNINEPHLDMTNTNGKNYNNNLRFWKGTNISQNTILQFMLTNNSLASSIMISLKVDKL